MFKINLKTLSGVFLTAFAVTAVFAGTIFAAPASPNGEGLNDPPLVDTINLRNGSVIYGLAKEIEENKQKLWLIETTDGAILKLRRSQVAHVKHPSDEEREYVQKKSTLADSVDAHWDMQLWCRDKRLHKQREYHLIRVIELDPDHRDARSLLKYKDVEGVWVQTDHFDQNNGYVKDTGGISRLPLAIEMDLRKEERNLVVKTWNRNLKNWLTKYKKRNDQAALNQLKAVRDPAAVEGITKLIRDENDIRMQALLLDVLGQIESVNAQQKLVILTMSATDRGIRDQCLNLLKQPHYNRAGIVNFLLPFLNPTPKTSNHRVNTAAWIIGEMDEPSAVRPLIDALNTVHMVKTGASGANMEAGSGSDGQGLNMGKKPTEVPRNFQNPAVLDALKVLTGNVDYDFNEPAWLAWYIQRNSLGTNQLGRDR